MKTLNFVLISLVLLCVMGCAYLDSGVTTARGCRWIQRGDYDRAINTLTMAISEDPNDYEAYYYRAVAYSRKTDYAHAILDLNKAIDLNSTYYYALIDRSGYYAMKKQYGPALDDINKAISSKPNYYYLYLQRGELYQYSLKNYSEALIDYDKALKLEPNNLGILLARAVLLYDMKDYSKAFSEFENMSKSYSDNPGYCCKYAWLLVMCPDLKYRNPEKALALAFKAVDKKACSVSYDTVAAVYAEKNDFKRAIDFQIKAISAFKEETSHINHHLGTPEEVKHHLEELNQRLTLYQNGRKWEELSGKHRSLSILTKGIDYDVESTE